MKKHIPNLITSLNLFTGCVGVYFAFRGDYSAAFLCIMLCAVFDFLDGFAARLLKAYSEIGKQLDSLADIISFGFLPGALVFSVLSQSELFSQNETLSFLAFVGFVIPIFSAFRLAKFNVDERQSDSFLGLPTPASAIFWGGMVFSFCDILMEFPIILSVFVFIFCLLLVLEHPMFSLKFKGFSWRKNKRQYIFLLGCIALIVLMRLDAFAPIIAWYIALATALGVRDVRKKLKDMKKYHSIFLLLVITSFLFSCSQRVQEKDAGQLFGFYLGQIHADAKIESQQQTESIAGEKIAFVQEHFTLKVNRQELVTMLRADSAVSVQEHFLSLSPAILESMQTAPNCVTERIRADVEVQVEHTSRRYGTAIRLAETGNNIRINELPCENILPETICRLLESGKFELLDNEHNPIRNFFIGTVSNSDGKGARGFLTLDKELFWVCL